MKYTNKKNYPQPLVDAVIAINERYDSGDSDFTVTGLLAPPRIKELERRHRDELEVDVADLMFSVLGTTMHHMFEIANSGGIVEERYYVEINGKKVSAQVDYLGEGMLVDWKMMSVWEAVNGLKPEKAAQMNIQAYLAEENGQEVRGIRIGSFYRDWSKPKSRDEGYPDNNFELHKIPRWSKEEVVAFIKERMALHLAAREELPLCTVEERWAVPDKTAVMKKGRKRAVKLFEDEGEAKAWMNSQDDAKEMYLEARPGESKRCRDYCQVSAFCTQRQEMLNES